MDASLLQILHDYRLLHALQRMGVPLDPEEATRLRAAEALLRGEALRGPGERRAFPRLPFPHPAQLTCTGRFLLCRVLDASGGGLRIGCVDPLPPGEEVLVHLTEPTSRIEYTFPARVAWCRAAPRPEMGLAFDGIPTLASPTGGLGGPRRRRTTPFAA